LPGKYLGITDHRELGKYAMAGLDPDFPKKLGGQGIIVAGRNFGCGSSREEAPLALKNAGVLCVVASSFARIFYRNAINVGLPVVELDEAAKFFEEGDMASIDLAEGIIENENRRMIYRFKPLPEFIRQIIASGGLVNYMKKRMKR
ncbi:3-isopropylmalate dehydratase small subunit, partial [Candidatus Bathyarchaeota archaeon]|nr:3-isopropylmalate dehydratase small subunit [Candidatus Bathyarchaeota archaeon]